MAKVTLRKKAISGQRQSLYLDIYPPIPHPVTGKLTRRDFLGLHIFDKPKSTTDKQHNKETLLLAENIKAKRQLEIQSGNFGFLAPKRVEIDFLELYQSLTTRFKKPSSTYWNWHGALVYIKRFSKGEPSFAQMDEQFCNEFRDFLKVAPSEQLGNNPLSQNTARLYFNKIIITLREAYKRGIITKDISSKLKPIPIAETHREYLSLEELQILAKTNCKKQIIKQASLFSALTGLRFSDVKKLLWDEIHHSKSEGYYISFRQKKTKGIETHPISEQAYQLLGKATDDNPLVFPNLVYSSDFIRHFRKWIKDAGITKHISFHCFRHTYATLQLSLGTDIYTVSKMLGHRELKTTQIYAKIIDKAKRAAADKIKLDL